MQIKGTIKTVVPIVTGTTKKGAPWAAQQYILETEGENKESILLEVFGQDKIDEFALAEGDTVTVSYVTEVNEYKGHYFGKNRIRDVNKDYSI